MACIELELGVAPSDAIFFYISLLQQYKTVILRAWL